MPLGEGKGDLELDGRRGVSRYIPSGDSPAAAAWPPRSATDIQPVNAGWPGRPDTELSDLAPQTTPIGGVKTRERNRA